MRFGGVIKGTIRVRGAGTQKRGVFGKKIAWRGEAEASCYL